MQPNDKEQKMCAKGLTPPQRRYLAEIREQPGRAYNGRARRTVEALAEAGYIRYEYELVPRVGTWTERYTCWPVEGKAVV